jgi:hypothetical protein
MALFLGREVTFERLKYNSPLAHFYSEALSSVLVTSEFK